MTTNLKAKLLQHFASKKANGGFTLIELLVVIVIIGILSAIALPSFLNQGNRARQSEAQTYVGSMNRAQQTFYLENGEFATEIPELGLGVDAATANYAYAIEIEPAVENATGDVAVNTAISDLDALRDYAGPVALIDNGQEGGVTTSAVLCEANAIDLAAIGAPTVTAPTVVDGAVTVAGSVECPEGMTAVGEG